MRIPQLFKLIVRLFLLSLTISLSFVSFLGGLSAYEILTNEENIEIDTDDIETNIEELMELGRDIIEDDFNGTSFEFNSTNYGDWFDELVDLLNSDDLEDYDVDEFFFELKFKITNAGYFDLEDLYTRVKVYMVYEDDDTGDEESVKILDEDKNFPTIYKGESYKGKYKVDYKDLIEKNFPDGDEIDFDENIKFTADIFVSGKYSLKLIEFEVNLYDVEVFDEDMEYIEDLEVN